MPVKPLPPRLERPIHRVDAGDLGDHFLAGHHVTPPRWQPPPVADFAHHEHGVRRQLPLVAHVLEVVERVAEVAMPRADGLGNLAVSLPRGRASRA